MNEIEDLNQILIEIKFYEHQTAIGLYEIGKRLKVIKNKLGHGNWIYWVNKNLGYSYDTAYSYICLYDKYSNLDTFQDLSFSKLMALTTIEDEQERKKYVENNDVNNMTVRRLQKSLKEYQDKDKLREEEIIKKDEEIKKLSSQQPKIIEKEVIKEIQPSDYKHYKARVKTLESELEKEKYKNSELINDKKLAISQLKSEETHQELIREINGFAWTINGFIKDVGGLLYLCDYIEEVTPASKKLFLDSARHLREFSEQLYLNVEEYVNE